MNPFSPLNFEVYKCTVLKCMALKDIEVYYALETCLVYMAGVKMYVYAVTLNECSKPSVTLRTHNLSYSIVTVRSLLTVCKSKVKDGDWNA